MDNLAPDDILVLVCHPQAEAWMPLREWMRKGSGSKPLIRPIAAKHAQTGESLPLTAIPLAVRNDPESWEAVRLGWIHDPDWPNEFYNARIDRVDAKEGTLRVTAGQDQRNIVIADDTEMILL